MKKYHSTLLLASLTTILGCSPLEKFDRKISSSDLNQRLSFKLNEEKPISIDTSYYPNSRHYDPDEENNVIVYERFLQNRKLDQFYDDYDTPNLPKALALSAEEIIHSEFSEGDFLYDTSVHVRNIVDWIADFFDYDIYIGNRKGDLNIRTKSDGIGFFIRLPISED